MSADHIHACGAPPGTCGWDIAGGQDKRRRCEGLLDICQLFEDQLHEDPLCSGSLSHIQIHVHIRTTAIQTLQGVSADACIPMCRWSAAGGDGAA